MSPPKTSMDTPNATSSPASADGPWHLGLQDGRMIDLCGPDPVLASLSPRQARALGLTIHDTSIQPSSGSFDSDCLQSFLENRLQAKMQNLGSTLYSLAWKPWVTPGRRSLFRLRASARRISETEFSGWVTPTTRDHKDTPGMSARRTDTGGSVWINCRVRRTSAAGLHRQRSLRTPCVAADRIR